MRKSTLSKERDEFVKKFVSAFAKSDSDNQTLLKELHPKKVDFPDKAYPDEYIKSVEMAENLRSWWGEVSVHYGISLLDISDILAKLYSDSSSIGMTDLLLPDAPAHLYITLGGNRLFRVANPNRYPEKFIYYAYDCLMKGGRHIERAQELRLLSPIILVRGILDASIWKNTKGFGTGLPVYFDTRLVVTCHRPSTTSIIYQDERGIPAVRALCELLRRVVKVIYDPAATQESPRKVKFTLKELTRENDFRHRS